MRGAGGRLRRSGRISRPGVDGAARFRPRPVSVLRVSAAGARGRPARGVPRAAGAHRQALAGGDGRGAPFSGRSCRVCGAPPCGRPVASHALVAAIRERRLQLPASRSVWRTRLSLAGGAAVVAPRGGCRGWRTGLAQRIFRFDSPRPTERQRPRRQSRVAVLPLRQGDAVVFPVNFKPVGGVGGRAHRVRMRHGVSRLRAGSRHTLGLIFHDAA